MVSLAVSAWLAPGFATRRADQSADLNESSEHRSHIRISAVVHAESA